MVLRFPRKLPLRAPSSLRLIQVADSTQISTIIYEIVIEIAAMDSPSTFAAALNCDGFCTNGGPSLALAIGCLLGASTDFDRCFDATVGLDLAPAAAERGPLAGLARSS